MMESETQRKAEAAWKRIESLGGDGIWDGGMVLVSLSRTAVTDDDLTLFRDFPFVQILALSHTSIGDEGLVHLAQLPALEDLIVIDTRISPDALAAFQRERPEVKVVTEPPPKGTINRLTGEPL